MVKQLYTRQLSLASCKSTIQWTVKTDSAISIVLERKLSTDINYSTVSTQTSVGGFASRNFSYTENLNSIPNSPVKYRIIMNIAADTSFYLDSMTVSFTPKPNLGADVSTSKCPDNSINLTNLIPASGLSSTWTIGGVLVPNPLVVFNQGTYQLVAVNISGCADTALVILTNNLKPALGPDKSVTKCSTNPFDLTTQYSTSGLNNSWTLTGVIVPTPSAVIAPGIYQLVATNSFGCSDTALFTLANDPLLCPVAPVDKITILPNPVYDQLRVTVIRTVSVNLLLTMHNSAGQKVYSMSAVQPAGGQTYNISMSAMAADVYYLTIRLNGKKELTKKIVHR